MGCDLCGAEGQLFRAKVEGSMLTVCTTCKEHGEVMERIPSDAELKQQAKYAARRKSSSQSFDATPRSSAPRHVAPSGEVILLVKRGFGAEIKQARENMNLKQEQLAQKLRIKESQLHKYETGAKKPDLETARMLEKALRITLVEQHVEEGER
ncbi:TIGR00270 family protein, partial [Candidatus Woesearchaeota archaeon]|nr:TIGR00270 family protein [Candidatus Woesearchaeota archaeon]